jgi:hypothetical protein
VKRRAKKRLAAGQVHGLWTVVAYLVGGRGGRWKARCVCGVERVKTACQIVGGRGCRACVGAARRTTPESVGYLVLGYSHRAHWRVACRECGAESVHSRDLIERNVRGCRACSGLDLIDLTGRTIVGWKVLGRATPEGHTTRQVFWRVLAPCCGREFVRASQQVRRDAPHACFGCAIAAVRIPDAERVCRWCARPTTRTPVRECGACERRALRNGREADGRPILKSAAISSAALARHARAKQHAGAAS